MTFTSFISTASGISNRCGGSLLSKRYVISAAHCVSFTKKNRLRYFTTLSFVRIGEWKLSSSEDCGVSLNGNEICAPKHIDVDVLKNITHEDYSPEDQKQQNDVALIELDSASSSFEFNDFIKPICLPLNPGQWQNIYRKGTWFNAAGWGTTETKERGSDVKLKVRLPFFQNEKYNDILKNAGERVEIWDKQICAGGIEGKDTW